MFYCDNCKDKKKWPASLNKSGGACEICGCAALCNDMPSAILPDPIPEPERFPKIENTPKIFEKMLKELCISYDLDVGDYPENQYEGRALFNYYLEHTKEENVADAGNIDYTQELNAKRWFKLNAEEAEENEN